VLLLFLTTTFPSISNQAVCPSARFKSGFSRSEIFICGASQIVSLFLGDAMSKSVYLNSAGSSSVATVFFGAAFG